MTTALSHLSRAALLAAACLATGPLLAAEAAAPVTAAPANVLVGEGANAITGADLRTETATLDAEVQRRALASAENVKRMAVEMYIRRVLAGEAVAQGLDRAPDVAELLKIVRERVLADALAKRKEAAAKPTGPVLENLAEQIYKSNPQRFQQGERVHVRQILIPLQQAGARATAEALRQQILDGANFAELARQNSKDPATAPKGGDLGFFTRGKMVKPFEDAAFALAKPGDVSPVVESQFGYHIIELVQKRPAGLQPFDEVKDALTHEAAESLAANARQALVGPVMDAMKVHDEAIAAFSQGHAK
ncbi:MAG: peptidylprolyl isomerase [Comamonas sp.]